MAPPHLLCEEIVRVNGDVRPCGLPAVSWRRGFRNEGMNLFESVYGYCPEHEHDNNTFYMNVSIAMTLEEALVWTVMKA